MLKNNAIPELQQGIAAASNGIVLIQDGAPPYIATCTKKVLQQRFDDSHHLQISISGTSTII